MAFPPVLTEVQAREAVHLPPPTGTPDEYTDRVNLYIAAITEHVDVMCDSTDADGADRWPTTADLPASITLGSQVMFAEQWSADVGAHSPAFGPDRGFTSDPPVGPAFVFTFRPQAWMAPYLKLTAA